MNCMFPHFHSCFSELWMNCGTVEEKATNTSTTVVVCIRHTTVVECGLDETVVDELWR